MRTVNLVVLVWALVLGAVGCATPPGGETRDEGPVLRLRAPLETVWQAAIDVVEGRFVLRDRDKDAGYLLTEYKQAPSAFEFWAMDAVEPRHVVEDTLHVVRRRAEAHLQQAGDEVVVAVAIHRERKNFESPRTSFSAEYSVFPGTSEQVLAEALAEPTVLWTPVGRDRALEQKLLDEIREKVEARLRE